MTLFQFVARGGATIRCLILYKLILPQDRTGKILFKLFDKDPSHFPNTLRSQVRIPFLVGTNIICSLVDN